MMYVDENSGTFPGIASEHNGFQAADWIYCGPTRRFIPRSQKSPIVGQVATTNRALFRCPLDVSDADRLAQVDTSDGPYLFSYSLTGFGRGRLPGFGREYKLGHVLGHHQRHHVPFQTSFGPPSFAQNHAGGRTRQHSQFRQPTGGEVINDGRWMPNQDALTCRHRGRADVTFADGHVEAAPWQLGNDITNSLPSL